MMSDYSPQEVRGSSQISSSEWDELPDRLEKLTLPSAESARLTRRDEYHLRAARHRNGPTEGALFAAHGVVNHQANGSVPFAAASMASTEVKKETTETRLLDGNPFGYTFALRSGFNDNSAQNAPAERRVDVSLIDPQLLGTSTDSTGSPKPRRGGVVRSTELHTVSTTTTTMPDEIPGTGSFQCTSSNDNTRSSSVFSTDTTSAYPTPSSDTPNHSSGSTSFSQHPAGHTTMEAGNPLLPAADLFIHQPLHQIPDITKFHVPAQTERFLASIEMLSTQARDSMFLLHRQHELAFTFYINIQSLERNMRMHQWQEFLDHMRFQCVNIRDGLVGALKNICWGFAEWMGLYKNELPCAVVLRAREALREASELKAAIDRFAYPTWQEMVAKEAAMEQPTDFSSLAIDQLFGDMVDVDGVMPNH
ncbi:hypothetical protein GX51_01000 [Blastomyces parvus]|uniref:Uncharacterized protein n=1 Tax=Blastomyces parvus TaxID=2060905 RepID=A0A2B7XJJ9_9EURO|nr:hypothetical protein GX51_01000 [Blastomyces parvus]